LEDGAMMKYYFYQEDQNNYHFNN